MKFVPQFIYIYIIERNFISLKINRFMYNNINFKFLFMIFRNFLRKSLYKPIIIRNLSYKPNIIDKLNSKKIKIYNIEKESNIHNCLECVKIRRDYYTKTYNTCFSKLPSSCFSKDFDTASRTESKASKVLSCSPSSKVFSFS